MKGHAATAGLQRLAPPSRLALELAHVCLQVLNLPLHSSKARPDAGGARRSGTPRQSSWSPRSSFRVLSWAFRTCSTDPETHRHVVTHAVCSRSMRSMRSVRVLKNSACNCACPASSRVNAARTGSSLIGTRGKQAPRAPWRRAGPTPRLTGRGIGEGLAPDRRGERHELRQIGHGTVKA